MDTCLTHSLLSDCLHKAIRVSAFLTGAHNLDDHDLLRVGGIVEDVGACLNKCEGKDGGLVALSTKHFFLEDLEGAVVEDIVRVHDTVLHVNREVARLRDREHERVVLVDAVDRVEDLFGWLSRRL